MIKQFANGRVYVFIDAANILYSQQTLRWKVDYEKLKKYLEKECDLIERFYRILWIKKSPRRSGERFDIINIAKLSLMSSKN